MPLIASNESKGADFDPLSAGLHHAVCYGVIDLGTQPANDPQYKDSRKVLFLFETPDETITIDGVDKPRAISEQYTLSLNEKGNLRPVLESWRGRPFTPEELNGFDVFNVLGANCYLNVVHKTTKLGKTFAKVASVNPLPKSAPKKAAFNPLVKWSIQDQPATHIQLPDGVPDWIIGRIKNSLEWLSYQKNGSNVSDGAAFPTNTAPDTEEDCPF